MNRLVCTSAERITPDRLPPADRAASPGRPARVLFLHTMEVGFATTTESLEHFCSVRDDIDAVHVRLAMPRWLRLACKQSPVPIGELDYRYLRHMIFWRMHLASILGRGKVLPPERFDVVHIMTQQRAAIVPRLTARRTGGGPRFVINLDATLRNWESMRGLRRLAPPIDWAMEGRVLRAADMVACASRWAARSCETDSGVDPARIVIHKPCARVPDDRERPAEARPVRRLLFIGGNWRDKGGDRLVRWHQERWVGKAELHLVSGSAPRIQAPGVIVHGRVERSRLVGELMPTMDVLVVPTKWDTFMIAAQEAMAAGLPVVTTRTGALDEVVVDGETGFLCPHGDDASYIRAVERLMGDAALLEQMSRNARAHARQNLSASVWHNHLLDQLVALADNTPLVREPGSRPEWTPRP